MKTIIFFSSLLLLSSFLLFSCVDSKEEVTKKITKETQILPFLNKKKVDNHLTTITSREELESIINLNYEELYSKIPSKELLAFIESVEYNERGITTLRYDYLEKNLSEEVRLKVCKTLFIVEQNASRSPDQLMEFDGNGGGGACPHYNYKCHSLGSCIIAKGYICTCNC